ncbi:ISKra4 family transposase [Thermodesulfobacteriota bacterium]
MEKKVMQARTEFNDLLEYVTTGSAGSEIHDVELGIFRRLLGLGRTLLELFVASVGKGDVGPTVRDRNGLVYQYRRSSARQYLSIFGQILIARAHYSRQGANGLFPLDTHLNLPTGKYSYLLQDWLADQAVQTTFGYTVRWVKKILGLEIPHRAVQRINLSCTDAVAQFVDSLDPPEAEQEGSILVQSADGKGIRMCPKHRNPDAVRTKDKPGKKRSACVTRGYSTDPYDRTSKEIMDTFVEPPEKRTRNKSKHRKPCHRRTIASLTESKSSLFGKCDQAVKLRIHEGTEEKVVLMDGEKVLWKLSAKHFPGWTEILDFTHVVDRLRLTAQMLYKPGSRDEREYVRATGEALLEGHLDWVIEDFTMLTQDGSLSEAASHALEHKVLGYFRNNRHRMQYDRYLARGLPIASGIIESTCGNLIKDRMEGAGMAWSVEGAEAMVRLRGVFIDELWEEFWNFKTDSQKKSLYERYADTMTNRTNEPIIQHAA